MSDIGWLAAIMFMVWAAFCLASIAESLEKLSDEDKE
jgi:hypothetical protein